MRPSDASPPDPSGTPHGSPCLPALPPDATGGGKESTVERMLAEQLVHEPELRTGGGKESSFERMYAEHCQYVLKLVWNHGVPLEDVEDVAQTVWLQIHRRRDSYLPQKHKTPRAWITGFIRRCAANHRRTERRRALVLVEEPGEMLEALGLDPEQAAIVEDLHRLVPNVDQRLALFLQVHCGFSIAEIAAAQEVTEAAVERRLRMARKALERDGDKKNRSGAYLGFGSAEALFKALEPRPIPDEVGQRMWERIAERIQQGDWPADDDTPESDEDISPGDPEPPLDPSAALPAAPALPALASPALPALATPALPVLVTIGKAKLGALVLLAFLDGAAMGPLGALAWQAHAATRDDHALPRREADTAAGASISRDTVPLASASPPALPGLTSTMPDALGMAPAMSSSSAASATSPALPDARAIAGTPPGSLAMETSAERQSLLLLARMRRAMSARRHAAVLTLAEEHARRFGAVHVRVREAFRVEALRQLAPVSDVSSYARGARTAHDHEGGAPERVTGGVSP
jgi:RNA polymerase sigma factor (sigma-70 family)